MRKAEEFGLPRVAWPPRPTSFANAARREEIAAELLTSDAEVVVTLGDLPLGWFGKAYGSEGSLRAYGRDLQSYGRLHAITIGGRKLKLLPLVHPRQAAGLGGHSAVWKVLHAAWVRNRAPRVLT